MTQPTPPEIATQTAADASLHEPTPYIKTKKASEERFSLVWWLPFIALLITTYFAVNYYTSKGTLATITFKSAEGVAVNKTKVKYKDVVIGRVEAVRLNKDFKGVQVDIRMNRDGEGLLRERTQFWVVKPRIGLTQVTGLNTLLSGAYITLDPDKDPNSDYRYQFVGLEHPPIISQDEPGLKITLLSNKASSLSPGTAVYYKGIRVGEVNRVAFSDDYLWVKADIFIRAPHSQLIKPTTKFWSMSGISMSAGAEGVEVSVESVEALVAGGITFETPPSLLTSEQLPVDDGMEFTLFDNKKLAKEQVMGRSFYFVSYFNSSIKGLEEGSPVVIQGMKVGMVKEIRLLFDEASLTPRIPVLFEVYESRFKRISLHQADGDTPPKQLGMLDIDAFSEALLRKGLRVRLETANLILGTKQLSLVFDKKLQNAHATLEKDPITHYRLLPSVEGGFDELSDSVTLFTNKLNSLPLEAIADNLNALLKNGNQTVQRLPVERLSALIATTDAKIKQLPLKQTLTHFNQLLKEGKTLSKSARSALATVKKSANRLSRSAETVLGGYSADAPLYYNANTALTQLNDTLLSLKTVLDMLDRHPNSLVFGENKPQEPKNAYWKKSP